jgi:hypothetical protein
VQAVRVGQPLAPPVAVDVDVSATSPASSGGGFVSQS